MWNDAKTKYLFAFEAAVFSLIGEVARTKFPTGLRDGLWANAHMWHGIGLDPELAGVKFVLDTVARYHPHLLADQSLTSPPHSDGGDDELDPFTKAYITCALWSSTDNSTPAGGEPLDTNYSAADIAPDALEAIKADCRRFQTTHASLLSKAYTLYEIADGSTPEEYAGHDYWLTRNHHGCGWWDRDLGEVGEQLTVAAHAAGECDMYVGDDGKLYV